jgi:hypothetical protein
MKTIAETSTTAEAAAVTETAGVAEQGAASAPPKASSKKDASQKKNAPRGPQTAKKAVARRQAKSAPKAKATTKKASKPVIANKEAGEPRDGGKKAMILELLRRKGGATLAEIAKATQWQNHSIRGFISGTLGKKMGLVVESFKNATDERTYRLTK